MSIFEKLDEIKLIVNKVKEVLKRYNVEDYNLYYDSLYLKDNYVSYGDPYTVYLLTDSIDSIDSDIKKSLMKDLRSICFDYIVIMVSDFYEIDSDYAIDLGGSLC